MDLRGRLANMNLPTSKCLLPLVEAIVNSFHAIEETNEKGAVDIEIVRNTDKMISEVGDKVPIVAPPITGFHVKR